MMSTHSSPFISIIHLQRLKQLDAAFGTTRSFVDINQLAEVFVCSERNASKLMNTLASKGYVSWTPGRGRGNKSAITLPQPFDVLLLKQLESQVRTGQINEAFAHAEHFQKRTVLQEKLPLWLDETKAELSKENTLLYIVSYHFPEWRPTHALSASSILFLEAVFDTLVRYDKETGKIHPHLAHHYYDEGNQYFFRLRPDVYFHNGEKLEPKHVKACFDYRRTTTHPYHILFRHLDSIETKGDWVIFNMKQIDPIFLHLLTDIHSAVFYPSKGGQPEQTIGTGAYSLTHREREHWVLTKNTQYFGIGGLIERAEFWSTKHTDAIRCGHVYEKCPVQPEDRKNANKVEQHACAALEFVCHPNRLSSSERAWLVNIIRQFTIKNSSSIAPFANSIMPYHQEKGFHLFQQTMTKPTRPISLKYRKGDEGDITPLIQFLAAEGIEVECHVVDRIGHPWDHGDIVDIHYTGYVFGNNLAFQYYEWLLTSNLFKVCLNDDERLNLLRFVDLLMNDSNDIIDFMDKLYRAEDWLIQNCHYVPLWRDHAFYNTSKKLHGKQTDNMGVMSLSNLWLE